MREAHPYNRGKKHRTYFAENKAERLYYEILAALFLIFISICFLFSSTKHISFYSLIPFVEVF